MALRIIGSSTDTIAVSYTHLTVYAGFSLFQSKTGKGKLISGVIATLALVVLGVNYGTMDPTLPILPQICQQFNPFFVVALTPVSLAVFGSLAKKGNCLLYTSRCV